MSFGFTPRKSADKDPLGWNAEWENYVLEIHQKSQAHPELRPDLTAPTFEAFNSQGSITTTKQMKMDLLRIQNDLRGFVKEKSLGRIKSKWGQIPVSNRKLLLATAIGEVEVIGLNYLVGKRIICPELQVNSLIPTSGFCRILERYIQISSEPIITSNAIVDQFLGWRSDVCRPVADKSIVLYHVVFTPCPASFIRPKTACPCFPKSRSNRER